jgi:DNA-binding transcriptional MerR regulator
MISISELSSQTGLSTRVIRHYTSIGLICALENNIKRSKRNYRESEVETILIIRMLRELGLNLNEIGCIMGCKMTSALDFKINESTLPRADLIKKLQSKKNEIDAIFKYLRIK